MIVHNIKKMTDGGIQIDDQELPNKVANGIPMSVEQMRQYLQDFHGIPTIAIREQGSVLVTCPYCDNKHKHDPEQEGHAIAGCIDEFPDGFGIIVNERHFMPSYGYTIYKFRDNNGINELITPVNLR